MRTDRERVNDIVLEASAIPQGLFPTFPSADPRVTYNTDPDIPVNSGAKLAKFTVHQITRYGSPRGSNYSSEALLSAL